MTAAKVNTRDYRVKMLDGPAAGQMHKYQFANVKPIVTSPFGFAPANKVSTGDADPAATGAADLAATGAEHQAATAASVSSATVAPSGDEDSANNYGDLWGKDGF